MTAGRKVIVSLTVSLAAATAAAVAVLTTAAGARSGPARTATLSPEKQKIVDDEAARLAAANRNAAPKSQLASRTAAPTRLPDRVTGLVDMHQGPFPGSEFYVANFWQGPVGGGGSSCTPEECGEATGP